VDCTDTGEADNSRSTSALALDAMLIGGKSGFFAQINNTLDD